MPWTVLRASDAIVGRQLAPSGKPPQGFLNDGAVSLAVAQHARSKYSLLDLPNAIQSSPVASATAVRSARPENGLVR